MFSVALYSVLPQLWIEIYPVDTALFTFWKTEAWSSFNGHAERQKINTARPDQTSLKNSKSLWMDFSVLTSKLF